MDTIVKFSESLVEGMQLKIRLLGYTFSWWEVFLFEIVSSILIYLIIGFIFDD